MPIKVVTDSVSDISPRVADQLGITVVPLNIVIDGVTYRDGVDLTTDPRVIGVAALGDS